MTEINQAIRVARAVVEQQFNTTRLLDEHLAAIEDHVGHAWTDRQVLVRHYYATLQGVLRVWDDCIPLLADKPELQTIRAGLERILHDQSLEPMTTAVGDHFQPDTQCCEQMDASSNFPPGTIIEVLETGYCRRWADGTAVVVRPARVVVSQAPDKSTETSVQP